MKEEAKSWPFLVKLLIFICVLILAPFWYVFVKISNLIGLKWIRIKDRELQAPVVVYKHFASDKIVVLIGTIHLAESQYFNDLQRIIDSLEDHKILFEGIGKITSEQRNALDGRELVIARQFEKFVVSIKEIEMVMELRYQRDGLIYLPDWINTDMNMLELIRSFARNNIYPVKEEWRSDLFSDNKEIGKWLVNKLLYRIVPLTLLISWLGFFLPSQRKKRRIFLDVRNKIAWEGIDENLKLHDKIASIWGAAHLKGIDKYLRRNKFKEIKKIWLTAYHIRDYSLVEFPQKTEQTYK